MQVDILLGLQWGDEGKGKIVDYLASNYDIVARFQGGPNAGHTLKINGKSFVLHTIPSGAFQKNVTNVIGNGVVIDPFTLKKEVDNLNSVGVDISKNLLVSQKAHLILPTHKVLDAASEHKKGQSKIGSTLRGIGPTYMDKTGRNGLRVGDLLSSNFDEKYQALKNKHLDLLGNYDFDFDLAQAEQEWETGIELLRKLQLINVEYYLNNALEKNKRILAEGAQGSMLDIDFGTYPFVTSSNTISASACKGLGIAPNKIGEIYGISKAYCTRVGSGPFPSELFDEDGEKLRKVGNEFGATTGRPRRCGWIDLPALKYCIMLNGLTQLILTKIDVLNSFKSIKAGTAYRYDGKETQELPFDLDNIDIEVVYQRFEGWDTEISGAQNFETLPQTLKQYILFLEKYLNVPITLISNGPEREALISKSSAIYA
ncbi:MAG: adenylosuccinate synthase [Chitinophagales bacterium]